MTIGRPESPICDQDDELAAAVLDAVLDLHPAQVSLEELELVMIADADDLAARDRVYTAVQDLVGAGLLHRHGRFVFATHAAVRFQRLRP